MSTHSRRLRRSCAAATALVVAAACGAPAPDAAAPVSESPAATAESEQLMEADRAFARAVAARGTDAWVDAFAEDGAMLQPGGEVRGHDAIRQAMAGAFSTPGFSLTWEPTRAEISRGGDLGYTIGRYVNTSPGPDGPVSREGAYTTIWRRDPSGAWKVALDLGVPDPPQP